MNCGHEFQNFDPPVRTVSLEQVSPPLVKINNRHLGCMRKYGISFIPMSHVWHGSIALANLSTKNSLEASEHIFTVLTEILPTVTAKFSRVFRRVELWHDYLSIPQWNRPVQQALLLMLPHIYQTAPLCLIHFDDVTLHRVISIVDSCAGKSVGDEVNSNNYDRTVTSTPMSLGTEYGKKVVASRENYDLLTEFFQAHWFQRMWVSLEYAHCRQACLYTQDHKILWNGKSNYYDSFSLIFDGFQQLTRMCVEELGLPEFENTFQKSPLPLLGPLADMRKSIQTLESNDLAFGEALTFLAGSKCTCYRDRYLAMSSFLRCGDYTSTVRDMPKEAADACLWLARKCLENGDYSPLLMLRRGETLHSHAQWLVGHQAMKWDMWDLGSIQSYACEVAPIVNKHIELRLGHVGVVEKLWVLDFKRGQHLANFDFVVKTILSHFGLVDVRGFLRTIDRIYAVPTFLCSRTLSTRSPLADEPRLSKVLRKLLVQHLQPQTVGNNRLDISMKIVKLLLLQKRLKGTAAAFTGLSYASNPLHQVQGYNDCLAAVRCHGCTKSFLYRISILESVDVPVDLYRIRALEFSSSLRNGVGLLVSKSLVVGRMIYGTPACACRITKSVEIL
ncbi:hypothetical protein BKA66DRAFT_151133 [Pyrenochaeta sp. MPI-SDFR-AT-0127]|nr:hypothetical protein BKA66DRAFT_151133 [Pyrenochaeta sp. MPI-SDFR-AT-0127]